MMGRDIGRIIAEARSLVKQQCVSDAESKYLSAISELEKNKDSVNGSRELWTTRAEYLWFRSQFLTNSESLEKSRQRKLESIQLLWKSAGLRGKFERELRAKAKDLVKMTILAVGCIIREDESHVHIECPIRIRNMGAGQFGFSIACFFEKATCSICGRDVVKDVECAHIPGEQYDGKQCHIKPENLHIDHVALTTNPKDPKTGFTALSIPKNEFYSNFSEEQIRRKSKFGLPLVCSLCMKEEIDPTEISVEKFFQMQGLKLK
jgi:hypothetical protein